MDFSNISDCVLLERTEKLARTERKITHLILCHINEVDARKLYLGLDCENIYQYLNKHLGYGEDSAYRRMKAASVLRSAPQIAEKLESGSLNLTQLTQVQKCLKAEAKAGHKISNQKTESILKQIEKKNSYETLKVLAVEFNQPVLSIETLKPQSDGSNRLTITLTDEELAALKQAKDLLSHVVPEGNWKDLIVHLAKKEIKAVLGKKEIKTGENFQLPERPTMTFLNKSKNQTDDNAQNFENCALVSERSKSSTNETESGSRPKQNSTQSFLATRQRKSIKISTKRILLKKADHCCEFVNKKTGVRCSSHYQLQVDHRIPIARNGSDEVSNLRVLCRTHNLLSARQWGITDY